MFWDAYGLQQQRHQPNLGIGLELCSRRCAGGMRRWAGDGHPVHAAVAQPCRCGIAVVCPPESSLGSNRTTHEGERTTHFKTSWHIADVFIHHSKHSSHCIASAQNGSQRQHPETTGTYPSKIISRIITCCVVTFLLLLQWRPAGISRSEHSSAATWWGAADSPADGSAVSTKGVGINR